MQREFDREDAASASDARTRATQGAEPDPMTLAGTLCARMCHDLAGSLGALAATLDMAIADNDAEALALAQCCARDLSARLRLLRAAWADGAEIGDLAELVQGLAGAERLAVDIGPLCEERRRLAVAMMMAGAAALPRGGRISLAGDGRGVSMAVDGPLIMWPAALRDCLQGEPGFRAACASPRDVGFAMLWLHAKAHGLRVRLADQRRLVAD